MAIENTVSSDFDPRSSIVMSVFDCHLPGVSTYIVFIPSSDLNYLFQVLVCKRALFFLFRTGTNVVRTYRIRLTETVLLSTYSIFRITNIKGEIKSTPII